LQCCGRLALGRIEPEANRAGRVRGFIAEASKQNETDATPGLKHSREPCIAELAHAQSPGIQYGGTTVPDVGILPLDSWTAREHKNESIAL
jgi:hypothetical protein